MRDVWVGAGIGFGLALSVAAVAFAFVGLSPQFSWIPEIPFLLFAAGVILLDLAMAGVRAAHASGRIRDGAMAAGLAGAIGGFTAAVCYVLFGKSFVNLLALPLLGAGAGVVVGAASAILRR